jgi:ribose transport system permease protein
MTGLKKRRWWSGRNIGAIYVWAVIIIIFGWLRPELFLNANTAKSILNQSAITGLVALALVVPIACGLFDVSIGASAGLGAVLAGWLLTYTSLPLPVIVIIVLGSGLVVGAANTIVVVWLGVDSFVGTLAMSGILDALGLAILHDETLSGARMAGTAGYDLSGLNLDGITIPVLYFLVVGVCLGLVLEHTTTGRYWYAVGFDKEVARLAGIRVARMQTRSLLISGVVSAGAGLLLVGTIGSVSPQAGDTYLLPAFAAVFLGGTQFRDGRSNTWGTIVAVLLLGTGQYGLVLAGAPQWAPNVFQGVALIVAVGLRSVGRSGSRKRIWRNTGRTEQAEDSPRPLAPKPQSIEEYTHDW